MTAARAAVAARLRAEGGLLAGAVAVHDDAPGNVAVRDLALAAVREGLDLHTPGGPRGAVVVTADHDLALLAGDRLYALGLAELARAGDVEAVRVLAGVIAAAAASRGAGDERGAEGAWEQGFRSLTGDTRAPKSPDR